MSYFMLKVKGTENKYYSHINNDSVPVFCQGKQFAMKHENLSVLDDIKMYLAIEENINCDFVEYELED